MLINRDATLWIRLIRKSLGMTQIQLAKRLNITPQTICAIEKNKNPDSFSVKTLKKIAQALQCDLYISFVKND